MLLFIWEDNWNKYSIKKLMWYVLLLNFLWLNIFLIYLSSIFIQLVNSLTEKGTKKINDSHPTWGMIWVLITLVPNIIS